MGHMSTPLIVTTDISKLFDNSRSWDYIKSYQRGPAARTKCWGWYSGNLVGEDLDSKISSVLGGLASKLKTTASVAEAYALLSLERPGREIGYLVMNDADFAALNPREGRFAVSRP
jgi:hypothetical protein